MSLDSHIWIETNDSAEQVQHALARLTPLEIADDFEGLKKMRGDATSVTIRPMGAYDIEVQRAGVRADISIGVHCRDTTSRAWKENSVRAASALLHAYSGDLLFLYLDAYPALMRKNGRIILEQTSRIWDNADLLAMVDLPYEWGTIQTSGS